MWTFKDNQKQKKKKTTISMNIVENKEIIQEDLIAMVNVIWTILHFYFITSSIF